MTLVAMGWHWWPWGDTDDHGVALDDTDGHGVTLMAMGWHWMTLMAMR